MSDIAGVTHHLTFEVNSVVKGFMFKKGTYQRQRADDFAPRVSQGNDTATQETLWQSWGVDGLTEGMDQREVSTSQRYARQDGNIFPNRKQAISLAALWRSLDAAVVATAPMCIDIGTDWVLMGVGTKVRRYQVSTGLWSASTTTLAGNCIWLHRHGADAYAAVDGGNEFYKSTDNGDTWSQVATTPATQPAACFATWEVAGGTVYLVLATANTIKLSTDGGVTWGTAINIGDASSNITNLLAANGVLNILKEDSLWWYNGTSVQMVWEHRNSKYSGNVCLAYHAGFIYTNERNKVWKISYSDGVISNFSDETPYMQGDASKELYGHGTPKWMWSGDDHLYACFDDGEGVYPEVLYIASAGSGWQQSYRGTSGDTMKAGGYSPLAARTFINDGATRARRHVTLADIPFPDYAATGVFTTPIFTGDRPFDNKAYRGVALVTRNCLESAGRGVTVAYSLDRGSTFTSIGTVYSNGRTEFQFDQTDSAIANPDLVLQVTLTRGTVETETPVLERINTTFLLRPTPQYVSSATLDIGPDIILIDGVTHEDWSQAELLEFIGQAETYPDPIRMTDMTGRQFLIFLSRTLTAQPIVEEDSERDTREVTVTMIDAVTGIWLQRNEYIEFMVESATATLIPYVAAVWDTPTWDFFQWE